MAGTDGSAYNLNDPLSKASGITVNAKVRTYRNVFNFADAGVGGTTAPLLCARLPRGCVVVATRYASTENLSGSNQSIGIAGTPAKYAAAAAGPAAGATRRVDVPVAALAGAPLTTEEDVILTPAANWPASGTLVTFIDVIKR